MRKLLLILVVALAAVAGACGGTDAEETLPAPPPAATTQAAADTSSETSTQAAEETTAAADDPCAKESLELLEAGMLTIGTDNPAFPPWFGGGTPEGSEWEINDPATGKGFESAVAYAVAEELGFSREEVRWTVVPFSQSFRPGAKSFDFDINQISYSDKRARAVDFSESYYDVNQALVALKANDVAGAASIADLADAKLAAPVGTTSYDYIVEGIQPSEDPSVYDTLNDTISALKARQVDGIVVDLPTAFFVTAVQVENGTIVGQFPATGEQEYFGMVFEKDNPLVSCVNEALAALEEDGTLEAIQQEWLSDKASAPVLE